MSDSKNLFLLHALKIGALELLPEGRKLKSGRISPYFFNSGLFTTGEDLSILADLYVETIRQRLLDGSVILFGPAYKGIPLVTSIAMSLYKRSSTYKNISWAFNRKEVKDHGEGGELVGAKLDAKKVMIIDDVITTGGSIEESIDIIRNAGGTPIGAVVGFDRQERGTDTPLSAVQTVNRKYGIPIVPSVTLDDLIKCLKNGHEMKEIMLPKILEYREQYGC